MVDVDQCDMECDAGPCDGMAQYARWSAAARRMPGIVQQQQTIWNTERGPQLKVVECVS